MSAFARTTARCAAIAATGATAVMVVGLAASVAVVGVAALDAGAITPSIPNALVASPAQQGGQDDVCADLWARHKLAMELHPSDAAQARVAAQSILDLNC